MSYALPPTKSGTAKELWKRAPWWRFCVLSGALLVFLMILFPPRMRGDLSRPAPAPLTAASYQPPPQPPPQPDAPDASALSTQAQATAPSGATPLAHGKPSSPPPGAHNATLQLATAANPSSGGGTSGIDQALMGRAYQRELLMDGFKVPLPPGDWVVLASSSIKVTKHPENTGMNYFLGQIEHARLVGAIIVIALRNGSQPETGFEEFHACSNPDNIYASSEEITPFGHQACWIVHTIFTPPMQQWADKAAKIGNLYRAAAGDMAAKGVTYPQDLIAVHFFRSETWGLLEASYVFSPERQHIDSNVVPTLRDSDWFGANLQRYPQKLAYIENLKRWGEAHWPQFKAAFEAGR